MALVGPSGAGKTSLLRTIAGLERPRTGQVRLGSDVWFDAARRIDRRPEQRRVGYLPQDYALFPHLSVAGNVRFAARRDRPDLLDRLGIVHLAAARPAQLSGGERQRTALARALARDPQVLLLDEPFGALDPISRAHVRDELGEILADIRLPTLLVTHAFEDASIISDRVGVMDRGQIVQVDSPDAIQQRPATSLVAQLTGANILHGTATATPWGATVQLEGGGRLDTTTSVAGRVSVALYPWTLTPTDPEDAALIDTVVAVRQQAGTVVLQLTRLTVHLAHDQHDGIRLDPGTVLGLTAPPDRVHVVSS